MRRLYKKNHLFRGEPARILCRKVATPRARGGGGGNLYSKGGSRSGECVFLRKGGGGGGEGQSVSGKLEEGGGI